MSTSPSLSLAEIRRNLHGILISEIKDTAKFGTWLDMLLGDIYGRVLCVNLYIDLKNRCLDSSLVANVINRMEFVGRDPRWAFFKYIEDNQDETHFKHLHGRMALDSDVYERILPLSDMVDYYFRKPLLLSPLTYEAEQEVLERFLNVPAMRRERLGVVTEVWRGRMLNVWVTSKREVDAATSGVSDDQRANTLRDRLGVDTLDTGRLMGITYPANFALANTYVPSTLDSHFGLVFYVSTDGSDRWGLTCSLDTTGDGLGERVHEVLDGGLTDEFEMRLHGSITRRASPDLNHLINVALGRAH